MNIRITKNIFLKKVIFIFIFIFFFYFYFFFLNNRYASNNKFEGQLTIPENSKLDSL